MGKAVKVLLIARETEKAFEVWIDMRTIIWLPKSQMDKPEMFKAGDRNVEFKITEWIAKAKGIL